ncbi:MAG: hypothetical protein BWY00_00811 [Firmicutes bacterium ADurb.Bin153]|nr:MAG: hypothetical protein BWY00_00811 [Firmicutes bacterium ADurb.Bin153]
MRYIVHKLEVKLDDSAQELERFLNGLTGEVFSIVPIVVPAFFAMGASSKTKFLLIVEKLG